MKIKSALCCAVLCFILIIGSVLAGPVITAIKPDKAAPGQTIRVLGTGFLPTGPGGSPMFAFFRQGNGPVAEVLAGISNSTGLSVTVPTTLIDGPVSIRVSTGANMSPEVWYMVSSSEVGPILDSFYPPTPSAGQNVFLYAACLTPGPYQIYITQASSSYHLTAHVDFPGQSDRPLGSESAAGVDAFADYWQGGFFFRMPGDLVPGPATVRVSHEQPNGELEVSSELPFSVGETPHTPSLISLPRTEVCRGQILAVTYDFGGWNPAGYFGNPVLRVLQGGTKVEMPATVGRNFLCASLPLALAPGPAQVCAVDIGPRGEEIISNALPFNVTEEPLRPITPSLRYSETPGIFFSDVCGQNPEFLTVPFSPVAQDNLVKFRQKGQVFETIATASTGCRITYQLPASLAPGFAEMTVIATFAGHPAPETLPAWVEVPGAPQLDSLSLTTVCRDQQFSVNGTFSGEAWQNKLRSGPYTTSASIVEPGRASFVAQASPGSYQVSIEEPGGVTGSKTLVITESPGEISFLTWPGTVTPGSTSVCAFPAF